MRGTNSEFEREDALVCADVLGGFGVSSDHVREHVPDVSADATAGDLESAIQRALADPEHPTAFVRRTVAKAPRGVDAPVRFWTTAPETQLGGVFAALSWTFDVKSANGRSLSVDDERPYQLRVEDADGRARSTTFSFPDTPLGDDNYPALVAAINRELLYGLDCRFVQLSDGTDRWRFALVETEELARLRERFGERLTVFERPLLAADQPDAYAPDEAIAGSAVEGIPVPSWARDDDERSWRGRRLTADAFDADHVGGLDHLHDGDASTASEDGTNDVVSAEGDAEADSAEAAAVIEFAEADSTADGDADAASDPDSGVSGVTAGGGASDVVRDAEAAEDDDLDGWSIGGTVDATTRSSDEAAATTDAAGESASDSASTDAANTTASGSTTELEASGFDWGNEDADDGDEGSVVRAGALADEDSSAGESDADADADENASDDGFFSADAAASFDAGAQTSRVEPDSFGVDAGEQTDEDEFAAVGAALAAPAGISVGGLLDDEEFLPHLPRAEPETTRIEFADEFDPTADPAEERETDDGFVWVNEPGGIDETRSSASD